MYMVARLAYLILSKHKHISGGEVSVNESLVLQVQHACGYLVTELCEHRHGEGAT